MHKSKYPQKYVIFHISAEKHLTMGQTNAKKFAKVDVIGEYCGLNCDLHLPRISSPSFSRAAMTNRLEQLLELHHEEPHDAFTRYAIALEYNARKDYTQAIEWFERLRADEPEYVPTYYMLAGVYRALDQAAKAQEIYNAGLQAAKKAGDTHALAELSAALEELEEE